jgi:hypothetical protein
MFSETKIPHKQRPGKARAPATTSCHSFILICTYSGNPEFTQGIVELRDMRKHGFNEAVQF